MSRFPQCCLFGLLCVPPLVAQTVVLDDAGMGMDDVEITPDGRYAVVRENTGSVTARVYDLQTDSLVLDLQGFTFPTTVNPALNGVAQDAVAVTNSRAIVIGTSALVLDLTSPGGPTLLAEQTVGWLPRDLEITPDGTLAVIRGGSDGGVAYTGGLYVLDLATGLEVGYHPGEPAYPTEFQMTFDVDSVAVTNEHAVCTSGVTVAGMATTQVTVWDLHPPGGGVPQVAYETSTGFDAPQDGKSHDLVITPDGQFAAVRSDLEVSLYRLDGSNSGRVWSRRLFGEPGPFGGSALDSIEATDDRIATISRFSNGNFSAQIDVFDLAGDRRHRLMAGDPHDLAITPDGTRVLARTSSGLFMYNLANWPAGPQLQALDTQFTTSSNTSFGAGLDSVRVTNDRVISMARMGGSTEVSIARLTPNQIEPLLTTVMLDRPIDLEISPDGTRAAVTGQTRVQVYDLSMGVQLIDHDLLGLGWTPWCDGVVMNDQHVVAFGYSDFQAGWVSAVELFEGGESYCSAGANSVGVGGRIYSTGTPSVAANDFVLRAAHLPANRAGAFFYGPNQAAIPFGSGFRCVVGQTFRFPFQFTDAGGAASLTVDYASLPSPVGFVAAGTTWNFQFLYRDPAGPGALPFNLTDGYSIPFLN